MAQNITKLPPQTGVLQLEHQLQLADSNEQLQRIAHNIEKLTCQIMTTAAFVTTTADSMEPGTAGREREFKNATKLVEAAIKAGELLLKANTMRTGHTVINATQNNYYPEAKQPERIPTYIDDDFVIG